GFTAFESGLALLPGAIVVGIMNPITGRIFDQYGAKWLTFIGLFILVITTFMFTNLTTETTFTYIAVEIGRASCRERVCIWVGAVGVKKNTEVLTSIDVLYQELAD